ncbi:2-hydroxychromene-2-carboxylate isomerase [Ramlibacter sp.]|uniref:2-hydroxychromene-2-carboxylate isomerase n=1 Tax=Ramlibacter sp. TaxID=1917967 RepID=UPI002632E7DF|nr:2-hydroxychromene-2-carboxylate isomerase [Ramlibacter sp.]MDB5954584.1 2-hydroxychromene-2-carboxylate isomerase [Ramlibacter sp.]
MSGAAPVAIQYWLSTSSPWTWLGSGRFTELTRRTRAHVEVLPLDLSAVFATTGGLPVAQRPAARRSYRLLELARWSHRLGLPLTIEPKHHPIDREPSSRLLIGAAAAGGDAPALSHAVLRALWAQDRDIGDWDLLADLARDCGLDGTALVESARAPATRERYRENTQRAISAEVFGSPTWVLGGERFWGQDRLDQLAERLLGA